MNDLAERKAKAVSDYEEVIDWVIKESHKIGEELEKQGKFTTLDGHKDAYAYIHEEKIKRLKRIFEKYNLPYREG